MTFLLIAAALAALAVLTADKSGIHYAIRLSLIPNTHTS